MARKKSVYMEWEMIRMKGKKDEEMGMRLS